MEIDNKPEEKKIKIHDVIKPEPVVNSSNYEKQIDQKSKSDQKAMSVHEGMMFQCSNCN